MPENWSKSLLGDPILDEMPGGAGGWTGRGAGAAGRAGGEGPGAWGGAGDGALVGATTIGP